jgi:hypothetical protein
MSALKDLRDLVNVSRLTFREESSDENVSPRSEEEPKTQLKNKTSTNKLNKKPIISESEPVGKKQLKHSKPDASKPYVLSSYVENPRSSLSLTERSSLLDRNSLPVVKNTEKLAPLPAIVPKSNLNHDENNSSLNKSIEPLKDQQDPNNNNPVQKSRVESLFIGGNFDYMLAYIDASVVSDWLNRANRYLKKMSKWHRHSNFESYIKFCNFWLGFSGSSKFNDKQRRQLLEMEYSIIYEEVLQAFQVIFVDLYLLALKYF